jgi:hypothetical protein
MITVYEVNMYILFYIIIWGHSKYKQCWSNNICMHSYKCVWLSCEMCNEFSSHFPFLCSTWVDLSLKVKKKERLLSHYKNINQILTHLLYHRLYLRFFQVSVIVLLVFMKFLLPLYTNADVMKYINQHSIVL